MPEQLNDLQAPGLSDHPTGCCNRSCMCVCDSRLEDVCLPLCQQTFDISLSQLCSTLLCSERLVNNAALGVMLITLNNQTDLRIGRSHVLDGCLYHYTRDSSLGDDHRPESRFAGLALELEQQLRTVGMLSAHPGIAHKSLLG